MKQRLLSSSSIRTVNSIKVVKIRALTIRDMAKEQVGIILDHKFIKHHSKELDTYVYELEVSNKYRKWRIIKRLGQLVKLEETLKNRYRDQIPIVPVRKESDISQKNCEQMLDFFEIFVATISTSLDIIGEKCFLKFIQNLLPEQRKKMKVFKQIELRKQYGGRHSESIFQTVVCYFMNWYQRFFTITSEGVYYTDKDDTFEIKQMIPFSSSFTVLYGQAMTGSTYGIVINSSHRVLNMDAENIFNLVFFVYFLKKAMSESELLSEKRFKSFASIRQNCTGHYYIDSKYYFEDVYDALMEAKREVFITGWMISPYFCLKRPDQMEKTRFDRVLSEVASKGVKINIIIYMEPTVALSINSQFTENHLNGLDDNIKVLRHPAYLLIPFLWSHHEKMVIIDQKIAFLGGLDIGYGRWDDQKHCLDDVQEQIWTGIDYVNYRMKDILIPTKYKECTIDRSVHPRMPWHDVAMKIKGNSVIDLSRHFVQYWNYVNFQLNIDERQLLLYAGVHQDLEYQANQNKLATLLTKKKSQQQKSQFNQSQTYNVKKSFTIEKLSHQHQIVDDHAEELQFYAHHLKERNNSKIDQLLKRFNPKKIFNKSKNNNQLQQLIVTQTRKNNSQCEGKQMHQLIRSASMWGLGLQQNHQEKSIMNAYVQLIDNAKQFIYIENQFFISVENPIASAIKNRIIRAYEKGRKFRVIIMIPALPGFDGQPQDQNSATVRITMHHMRETICHGSNSILYQLDFIKNLDEYIQFFNLRTHGKIKNTPVTQIIYVHSKLMIVDDRIVLMGSANINDRSLLGSRDSQIGIIVEDQEKILIQLNNSDPRQVSAFAHHLRSDLFQEHFALTQKQAADYLNNDVWWSILQNAHKNQQIYREIFGCYPDNQIRNFSDIEKLKKQANIQKYDILSPLIKGNAVAYQSLFLQDEDLTIKPSQKQYYVPSINYN